MTWLFLTLLSAFSLASADAATKALLGKRSAREITCIRFGFSGLLLSPLLVSAPFPKLPVEFWLWYGALFPAEILAMLLYMRAIRDFPLAKTLPYMALTPLFVIVTGQLLLHETISAQGLLGILLIVTGAWLLNFRQLRPTDWKSWLAPISAIFSNPGSRMMVMVAALYSLTSVLGKGAMQYMPPLQFGAFYFASLGLVTLLIFSLGNPSTLRVIRHKPWNNLLVGGLMGVMIVCHFMAIQEVEVAYMIAVKRTSLLFGIIYGWLLFREQGLGQHLLAGALMVAGVIFISA